MSNIVARPKLLTGRLLANLLEGSWRSEPPKPALDEHQLAAILPFLATSGPAGLAWRKIRGTTLASTAVAGMLQATRRVQAVDGAIRESHLVRLLSRELRDADPILVKGWAHARLYPEANLRPYGDIDLYVRPERLDEARRACDTAELIDPDRAVPIDVQTVQDLPERSWDELYRRSRVFELGGCAVRVLGREDALRAACLHLLRHCGSNPLWLCDVAVMVEALPADFDWDYCLWGQAHRTQWVLAVIRLANQLLGADTSRCPEVVRGRALPGWFAKTVLERWGDSKYAHLWTPPSPLVSMVRNDLRSLPRAFGERCPNPLESVGRFSWPIQRFSGRIAQILDISLRSLAWIRRQIVSGGRWEEKQVVASA